MRESIVLMAVAALVGGCGGGGGSNETTLPFVTVASTAQSGVASHEEVVVRGSSELAQLWSRITVDGAPLPSVDFSAVQIVGVFLGSRPNGCYGVAITRITRTPEQMSVTYRESTPAAGAACTPATVTPAHLVAVSRSDLPVRFAAE
jgi:hypothetical protein